jgi:hypothetical protein
MDTGLIRRVPWTCQWGRFGVAVKADSTRSRVDDVFWGCHHPIRAPTLQLTRRGECETCPYWEPSPRFTFPC